MNNSNKPAHPNDWVGDGLTKREYFAAMAMQGILAHGTREKAEAAAFTAMIFADELLKQLSK